MCRQTVDAIALPALLEAQHVGILSPNRNRFCIAVLICFVVFDSRKMLSLFCPRQHFKPNLTHPTQL